MVLGRLFEVLSIGMVLLLRCFGWSGAVVEWRHRHAWCLSGDGVHEGTIRVRTYGLGTWNLGGKKETSFRRQFLAPKERKERFREILLKEHPHRPKDPNSASG